VAAQQWFPGLALGQVIALQTEVAVQPIYDEMPVMQESIAAIAAYGFTPSGFFPVHLDVQMAAIEFDFVAVRGAAIRDPRETERTHDEGRTTIALPPPSRTGSATGS
jgi:hypothetical protein